MAGGTGTGWEVPGAPASSGGQAPATASTVGTGSGWEVPGAPTLAASKPPSHGGLLHDIAKYSGLELAGNLASDVGHAAAGLGPGLYKAVKVGTLDVAYNIENAFTHPLRGAANANDAAKRSGLNALGAGIGHQYADYYGNNVLSHLYQHPLQPILDALTVADLGTTGAAKLGLTDASRAELVTRSPRLRATGEGPSITKLSDTKPLVRARQQNLHNLATSGAVENAATRTRVPLPIGESARYGKLIQRDAQLTGLRELPAYRRYAKAVRGLSPHEQQAVNVLGRGLKPAEYRAYLEREAANHGTLVDEQTLKILDSPKLAKLVDEPTPKVLRAYQASKELGDRAAELAGVDTKVAEARRFLPYATVKGFRSREPVAGAKVPSSDEIARRAAYGESPEKIGADIAGRRVVDIGRPVPLSQALAGLDRQIAHLQAEVARPVTAEEQLTLAGRDMRAEQMTKPGRFVPPERNATTGELKRPARTEGGFTPPLKPTAREVAQTQLDQTIRLRDKIKAEYEQARSAAVRQARQHLENPYVRQSMEPGHVGLPLDEIRQQFSQEGRLEPIYLPDVPKAMRGNADPFQGFGGGKGVPQRLGSSKLNRAILLRLGKVDLSNDVLGPEFLRRVKVNVHQAIHGALLDASVPIPEAGLDAYLATHGGIPANWEFLRAPVISRTGVARSQTIDGLRQAESLDQLTPEQLSELLPNPDRVSESRLGESLGTRNREEAFKDEKGVYYLAPKNMIRAAAGEFHRSSVAVRYLIEKPLRVWRALVLGLRIGFLTNNLVGNHLMYAIRTAGLGGLRSYLHAVQEAHGGQMVYRLLHQDYVPKGVTQQLMEEFFPDQIEGTFGRTQAPAREGLLPQAGSKIAKGARAATSALPAATSALAETLPRRALTETFIRRSPEFRQIMKRLPKQERSFDLAARKLLTGDRGAEYQRFISDQVNNSLGSYLNMNPFERNVVRNILPFYAWYRAIARVTAHLALDTPGRALAMQQLGQIGNQWVAAVLGPLPSYLEGVIPLVHNKDGTATVLSTTGLNPYSTLTQLQESFSSDVSQLGLNPLLQGLLDAYAKATEGKTGQRGTISAPELLATVVGNIIRNVPAARVISPQKPSSLYPHRSRESELLGFVGAPIKQPNVAVANQRASGG